MHGPGEVSAASAGMSFNGQARPAPYSVSSPAVFPDCFDCQTARRGIVGGEPPGKRTQWPTQQQEFPGSIPLVSLTHFPQITAGQDRDTFAMEMPYAHDPRVSFSYSPYAQQLREQQLQQQQQQQQQQPQQQPQQQQQQRHLSHTAQTVGSGSIAVGPLSAQCYNIEMVTPTSSPIGGLLKTADFNIQEFLTMLDTGVPAIGTGAPHLPLPGLQQVDKVADRLRVAVLNAVLKIDFKLLAESILGN